MLGVSVLSILWAIQEHAQSKQRSAMQTANDLSERAQAQHCLISDGSCQLRPEANAETAPKQNMLYLQFHQLN